MCKSPFLYEENRRAFLTRLISQMIGNYAEQVMILSTHFKNINKLVLELKEETDCGKLYIRHELRKKTGKVQLLIFVLLNVPQIDE